MSKRYFLTLDRGSTNLKAVLFNERLEQVKALGEPNEVLTPKEGWREFNLNTAWDRAAALTQQLVNDFCRPEEIIAVTFSAHGNGLLTLDESGQPVGEGIYSLDGRALDIFNEWKAQGLYDKAVAIARCQFTNGSVLPLFAWMKRHDPRRMERTRHTLFLKDWFRFRLTGEIASDYTDASGTGILHHQGQHYAEDVMDLLDVSELAESLAPLKQSTDLAGHVSARAASETGLLEGTPVFVGGHDICVTPIGVGAPDPSVMMAAFGTWSIATLNVSDTEGLPLVINAAAPNSFITGIGDGNAGAALDTMLAQNFQDYFAIAAKKGLSVHQYLESLITADDRNSLIFIPHLFGNFLNADASASLLGLRFHTQRTDILKAIIEGIVLGYRANLSLFPQLEHVRTIWLSGGGGRSNIIGQVMADVFQKTVLVPEDYELSARGAAVAAYVGSGTSELADAPRARVRRQFDPRPKMVSYYGPKLEILSKVLLEGNEIIAAIGALKV